MCIIIVKNSRMDLPDKEILKRCWNKNPHGAGFMYNYNDVVIIKKGFMFLMIFMKIIKNDIKSLNINERLQSKKKLLRLKSISYNQIVCRSDLLRI